MINAELLRMHMTTTSNNLMVLKNVSSPRIFLGIQTAVRTAKANYCVNHNV